MDYKDLGKSVLSTIGLFAFAIGVVQLFIWLANNWTPQALAGLLILAFFALGVKLDYDRRQFNKCLRK